jgi:MFS family permease
VNVVQVAQGTSALIAVPMRRSSQLLLLILATSVGGYAVTVVSPLQEAMRDSLSLTDNRMALLQGPARALAIAIAVIPLGFAIDRYSRARLLIIFVVLGVIGTALTALADSFALLFAARCLVGLTATASGTTAFSLLADLYAPAQRGRANMAITVAQSAGIAAAFAAGGALLAAAESMSSGWQWAILWLTVPMIPIMLAMFSIREPPRTSLAVQNPSIREMGLELWRYRAVIVPVLSGLVMAQIALVAALTWAAPVFSRMFALGPARIGAIMGTVMLVAGIVGPILGGLLADVCQRLGGPRRTASMLSGLGVLCVPAGFFAVMPDVSAATVLLALFMTIVGAISVAGITLFTIVTPNELRGLCMATLAGAEVVFGVAVAPMLVSALSGAMGGPAMIGKALAITGVTASTLSMAMFLWARRHV